MNIVFYESAMFSDLGTFPNFRIFIQLKEYFTLQ